MTIDQVRRMIAAGVDQWKLSAPGYELSERLSDLGVLLEDTVLEDLESINPTIVEKNAAVRAACIVREATSLCWRLWVETGALPKQVSATMLNVITEGLAIIERADRRES